MPHRLKVLYAEDDPDDVTLFEYALHQIRPTLRTVSNGDEAIRYLQGEKEYADRSRYPLPDLLFADWNLPRVNGRELLGWCQQTSDFRSLPVVVLTGSAWQRELDEAKAGGAFLALAKPNSFRELADCLTEILRAVALSSDSDHRPLSFNGTRPKC
jgi:CheY-like chemotaxis protein